MLTPSSAISSGHSPFATGAKYLFFGAVSIAAFFLLTAGPQSGGSMGQEALWSAFGNPVVLIPMLALVLLTLNEAFFHFLAGLALRLGDAARPWAPVLDLFHARFKAAFFLLLISPIFMAKRYLYYYYEWPVGESFRYVALTRFFKEAVLAGFYYPRWIPDLFYGYGYPTFLFYPPGYFYFSSAMSHFFSLFTGYFGLTEDILILDWITATIVILIGAMGAYLLAAESAGEKYGLAGALFFILSPYLMVNLQYRADMAELFSMAFLPYAFFFLHKAIALARARSRICALYSLLMSLALGLIFFSHPATALLFSAVFLSYGLFLVYLERGDKRAFTAAGILFIGGFGFALAISSPYWAHVFQLKSLVNLHAARLTHYNVDNWSAGPWDFFRTSSASSNFYQLGLPHFILCVLGALLNRSNPRIMGAFVIYMAVIFSLSALGKGLWSMLDLVRYVQFPWRAQTILATLQIICIGGVFSAAGRGGRRLNYFIYPALIFTLYWSSDHFLPHDREAPHITKAQMDGLIEAELANKDMRKNTWTNAVEFAPNHALILKYPITEETKEISYPWQHTPVKMKPAFRPAQMAQIESGKGSLQASPGNGKHHIQYEAFVAEEAVVRINQVFFPGWSVTVDGERIEDEVLWKNAKDEAIIKFALKPGAHRISAYYQGPPRWRLRNAAIFLAGAIYAGFSLFAAGKLRPALPEPGR